MAHDSDAVAVQDIWRTMTVAERQVLSQAFWDDTESVSQQVEAVQAIAKQYKFRPQSVLRLPPERRMKQLASMGRIPESVAARALVVYHLSLKRPMLEMFLDQLGIRHEQGVIDDTPADPPGADRLKTAVDTISASFPVADVRLYLRTLVAQDPDTWGGLRDLIPA